MKRSRLAMMLAFASLAVWTPELLSAELSVDSFLGPPVGKTYTYRVSENETVEVVGLSPVSKQGVKVEERFHIQSEMAQLPPGAHIRFPQYELINVDGVLVKTSGRTAEIVLQGPLIPKSSSWTRTEVGYGSDGPVSKTELTCAIDALGSQYVFNATRSTITVRCEGTEETPKLLTVITERYAEGIGLLERSVEEFSENGKPYGKLTSVLEKIESSDRGAGR